MPLLTPERPDSSSRDHPRDCRKFRTARATAAVTSAPCSARPAPRPAGSPVGLPATVPVKTVFLTVNIVLQRPGAVDRPRRNLGGGVGHRRLLRRPGQPPR